MFVIKATYKNIDSGAEVTNYIGKVMKKRVFTLQNRSMSFSPELVVGYKSLSACRKAAYRFFLSASDEAFKIGFTVSVNHMEVK